jgi:coenzyme F420 biosynthesis associated uncharacterized protein
VSTDELIDWSAAATTARRLARPGPAVSARQAAAAVAELRDRARLAQGHVRDFTGLDVTGPDSPVLVIDRGGWINANLGAVRVLSAPLAEKVRQWREAVEPGGLRSAAESAGAKLTGLELGTALAYLSQRVLGQFDPFGPVDSADDPDRVNGAPPDGATTNGATTNGAASDGHETNGHPANGQQTSSQQTSSAVRRAPGRLLLVAPNIVQVERELGVDPGDFRLWVCLHEETHRVQFGAVPWLRDHLLGEIGTLVAELDVEPSAFAERLRAAVRGALSPAARNAGVPADRVGDGGDAVPSGGKASLLDVVRTPEQRAVFDRLTAVMTLLEGHASYVMDGVGPQVVPSVAEISREFGRRRARTRPGPEALLRKVLGIDAKMRQYRDGERFVEAVVEQAGMDGFNRVWTSPNTLPTQAEIGDPGAWIRRVAARRA